MADISVNTKLFQSILNQGSPDALAKIVTKKGKSKSKASKDNSFINKNIIGETASKLGPVDEDTEMRDTLMKIYGFLKKSTESNIKSREKENNLKEENEYERKRRHKELLDAIKGFTGGTATKIDATDPESSPLLDTLLSVLGIRGAGAAAMTALKMLGRFMIGPAGLAIFALTSTAEIVSYLWKNTDKDTINKALNGEIPGQTPPGALPTFDQEQADKAQRTKASAVDSKGITNASLEELEAKRDLMIAYGDPRPRVAKGKGDAGDQVKAKQLDEIETEIAKRKSTEAPASPATPQAQETAVPSSVGTSGGGGASSASGSSSAAAQSPNTSSIPVEKSLGAGETVVPEQSKNLGDKLSSVTNENITNKLSETTGGDVNVVTQANNSATARKPSSFKNMLPAVRNLEPTFQRMIIESTRVV